MAVRLLPTLLLLLTFSAACRSGSASAPKVPVGPSAAEFARTHTDAEVVDETMRRSAACGNDFTCQVSVATFENQAVRAAKRTTALCTGVPTSLDYAQLRPWIKSTCAARHATPDQDCDNALLTVTAVCRERGGA